MANVGEAFVYILTSRSRRTLYVGVTSDLLLRVSQHRSREKGGFSARYALDRLVWYEAHASIVAAIAREKQLKGGSRLAKIRLIEAMNPHWRDLASDVLGLQQ